LNDLVAVLGEERVPAADVPALLRGLAPDHDPHRGLTGIKLREILERDYGIRVASTGNRYPVDPNKIRAYIARCAADNPDDRSG
jgi:DNA segregation ATPase FtsK/SpoIIIE, S-DNA-T family